MPSIFITGATGNVGRAVIEALASRPGFKPEFEVIAGVRDPAASTVSRAQRPVRTVHFDFEDATTFAHAIQPGHNVFLLRPPELASTKPFEAFLAHAKSVGVAFVVFLSVQGVERSSIIPHHRIEQRIIARGLPYCFLRPGYFMQNLTTTLRDDLLRGELFVVAGNAQFNWISVADIGRVAARVLVDPDSHQNARYDLTGPENLSFAEVVGRINTLLSRDLRFTSPSLLRFYIRKRREGLSAGYIFVLILLHYLPRFQAAPPLSDAVERITGGAATSLDAFVETELRRFFTASTSYGTTTV